MASQLVWFKRDLRISDHAPLHEAAKAGPCICLYVYEPELYLSVEFDPSHLKFINESLAELDSALHARGSRLVIREGSIPAVFDQLHEESPFEKIWSHEETGNYTTYMRDLNVKTWADKHGIDWEEIPQTGVIRKLKDRDGWADRWERRMSRKIIPTPTRIILPPNLDEVSRGRILSCEDLGIPQSEKTQAQIGGEKIAHETMASFLTSRGLNYRKAMSSPLEGWTSCSRLSPYLAFGIISVKQAYQTTLARQIELLEKQEQNDIQNRKWMQALDSFQGRLRWHCHFMQKLESEPEIEFENMSHIYDGMRENEFDEAKFLRFRSGQTGYPMIDACMRALRATGWINFRMRAMLVSFATYHLWLHWRKPALFLAKHFLDFEPGIHYPQIQMQAGVTGINTIRIYSPPKQALDQDPEGAFIRKYVPELEMVPKEYLAEPHKMPPLLQQAFGCVIGVDYPEPLVDHVSAYRKAKERIFELRQSQAAKLEAQMVYKKHGSRRRPPSERF
jgi:deoxyribodipyrimidine photo-lyase